MDFELHTELRELCGVKARNYRGYQNVPGYRVLLRPKGAKIIQKDGKLELRLEKMQPIELPKSLLGQIDFDEKVRRETLKSSWDYLEFFPPNTTEKWKLMEITLPQKDGKNLALCYHIQPRIRAVTDVQTGYASKIVEIKCTEYHKLKENAK